MLYENECITEIYCVGNRVGLGVGSEPKYEPYAFDMTPNLLLLFVECRQ